MYTVYILYSDSADRYYVGHTDDLEARLRSHNQTSAAMGKYARKNGPWRLVYCEESFTTRSAAMLREREVKRWKSRKLIEGLIRDSVGRVPTSRD